MFDTLITIALGLLVLLMGLGKIPVSMNPGKNQEYLNKYGMLLRVGGIVLIVVGLLLTISNVII